MTSSRSTLTAPCIWEITQSTPEAIFDINCLLRGFNAKGIQKFHVLNLTVWSIAIKLLVYFILNIYVCILIQRGKNKRLDVVDSRNLCIHKVFRRHGSLLNVKCSLRDLRYSGDYADYSLSYSSVSRYQCFGGHCLFLH